MEEITCVDCGYRLGWTYANGPTGSFLCDDCKEIEDILSADPDELSDNDVEFVSDY